MAGGGVSDGPARLGTGPAGDASRSHRQRTQAAVVASWPPEWSVGGPICPDGRVSPAEAAAVLDDVARRGMLEALVGLRIYLGMDVSRDKIASKITGPPGPWPGYLPARR